MYVNYILKRASFMPVLLGAKILSELDVSTVYHNSHINRYNILYPRTLLYVADKGPSRKYL